MARIAPILLVIALVSGCSASHRYTEADNQKTVHADLGTSFTVSLPASAEAAAKPAFSAGVLEMAPESGDDAGRRTFVFTARAPGDTTIRIGKDFSLRVRVVSVSDRPGMRIQ
jgi:hypothetical protein